MIERKLKEALRSIRREYDPNSIPIFTQIPNGGPGVMRHPLRIENTRRQYIIGSLYHKQGQDLSKSSTCVIYLHGNASSQLEGRFLVPNFVPRDIMVCCFDFVGCGMSDGDYWSLGWFEKMDVELVMTELHASFNVNRFFLWGRSMGAATAVMVQSPWLKGIIVDSGYSNVPRLFKDIAKQTKIPACFLPGGVWVFCKLIRSMAKFDPRRLKPVEYAAEAMVPGLFGHSKGDKFVPYDQGRELFEAYNCPDKIWYELDGDHNAKRGDKWLRTAIGFVFDREGLDWDPHMPILRVQEIQDDAHFNSFDAMIRNLRDVGQDQLAAEVAGSGSSKPKPKPKPRTEAPKTEKPKAEAPRTEKPKTEAPRTEKPKAEAPKSEKPKAEAPKSEKPKTEVRKTEKPKTEAPKSEKPKTEAPKSEKPKAERPKSEKPKTEQPKSEKPRSERPKSGKPGGQ